MHRTPCGCVYCLHMWATNQELFIAVRLTELD